MSSPTTTPAPAADPGFDPLVFWIQHKSKVVLLAAVFVVGLTGFAVSEYLRTSTNSAAERLLASASTVEGYQKVIADYPKTVSAGNAHLLLGAKLRAEGKYDESTATLRNFIEKFPDHPLVSGGWTSIAANQEAQGQADEALATYQKVTTAYANSFSAPLALLAQARLLNAKSKTDEARRLYEQVMTQFQDNIAAQQAAQEVRQLKK